MSIYWNSDDSVFVNHRRIGFTPGYTCQVAARMANGAFRTLWSDSDGLILSCLTTGTLIKSWVLPVSLDIVGLLLAMWVA